MGFAPAIGFVAYVIGRRFSVLHRFKGPPAVGTGAAFLASFLLYTATRAAFPWEYVALVMAVAAILVVTRKWEVPVLAGTFFVCLIYPLAGGATEYAPANLAAAAYLFAEALRE